MLMALTRKTPLRSKSALKRSGFPKRKLGLRSASPKRQKQYQGYAKAKKDYLRLHPTCERCGKKAPLDIHHRAGRAGDWLCDTRYFAALCRVCHDEVHTRGKESRSAGWIVDSHKLGLGGDDLE